MVKAAVLNLETEYVAILLTIQLPTDTEYWTVLTPLAAMDGLRTPVGLMALGGPPNGVKVPFTGAPVKLTDPKVLHCMGGTVMVGVKGLFTVIPNVLVIGQLSAKGVTTTV